MSFFASIRAVTALALAFLLAPAAGAQSADAAKVMKELGFPDGTVAKVRGGEMVKVDFDSSNERELAAGLAFLVKESPEALAAELKEGLLLSVDANVDAHGALSGAGSIDQLSALKLGNLEDAYRDASKDGDLNLSGAEVQAFQSLKGKPAAAVEGQMRQSLLERYQAYRAKGLDGIAPYARGGDQRSGAADLRKASQAAAAVKGAAPAFYDTLIHYPKKPASGFKEVYNWQRYEAHGEPTLILTHAFTVREGDVISASQRQFYVSGGYNVEQAVVGLVPVPEGTLVVYTNRTSTDQVAGFGGGAKRSMGKKLMASQLEGLFHKLQKAAVK